MSVALDALAFALRSGAVPVVWRVVAPPTRNGLGTWLRLLRRRYEFFNDWLTNGTPKVTWLAALATPESFLTAVVQTSCRKHGWPLDRTVLQTTVTTFVSIAEVPELPEEGAYVSGLFLEGAGWDVERGCLVPQERKQLHVELPVVHVRFMCPSHGFLSHSKCSRSSRFSLHTGQNALLNSPQIYTVEVNRVKAGRAVPTPVYSTEGRRDAAGKGLIFEVSLPTEVHESLWILQGVALVLNVDD